MILTHLFKTSMRSDTCCWGSGTERREPGWLFKSAMPFVSSDMLVSRFLFECTLNEGVSMSTCISGLGIPFVETAMSGSLVDGDARARSRSQKGRRVLRKILQGTGVRVRGLPNADCAGDNHSTVPEL